MKNPLISVVMPVFNCATYVRHAIESILAQTMDDFEFIIVNDGSTDGTQDIVNDYAGRDKRIRLLRNRENRGVAASLNGVLAECTGEFIARQDGDDFCTPDRLETQVDFLRVHGSVGVCGTWATLIEIDTPCVMLGSPEVQWRPPVEPKFIQAHLLFRNVLKHSSVVIRRSAFKASGLYYDVSLPHVEDYELWTRMSTKCDIVNLPKRLLSRRYHHAQVCQRHRAVMLASARQIRLRQLRTMGLEPDEREFALHVAISRMRFTPSEDILRRTDRWLQHLREQNRRQRIYDHEAFSAVLASKLESVRARVGAGAV